jgi:ParB/RepB/Spo0J family partition protein
MAASRRVAVSDLLGRPAAAPKEEQEGELRLVYVKTERLLPNPHNPRDDIGDLEDLKSIAEIQRQSLLVVTRAAYLKLYPAEADACRRADFIVANGCRRHAAAVKYGRDELICVVNDSVAESRVSLLRAAYDENVQRRDFDPIEEAKAVMKIVGEYATAVEAAAAEGWSSTWISHRKNLLKLDPAVQDLVRAKARGLAGISIADARDLGSVKGIEEMTGEQQLALLEERREAKAAKKAQEKAQRRAAKEAQERPAPAVIVGAADFSAEKSAAAPALAVPAGTAAAAATTLPAGGGVGETPRSTPSSAAPVPAPVPASVGPAGPGASSPVGPDFSAEKSAALHPVPEQREQQAAPEQAGHPRLAELMDAVRADPVAAADAICSAISPGEAYKLAQAMLDRLRLVAAAAEAGRA